MQKKYSFLLFLLILTSICFSQDYIDLGKNILKLEFQKNHLPIPALKFDRVEETEGFLILESCSLPCFIAFDISGPEALICAFSLTNSFGDQNLNSAPMLLLNSIRLKSSFKSKKPGTKSEFIPVGPLLKSKWNQDTWYNRYCPYNIDSEAGENTYAGCVSVAMSQILRHYARENSFYVNASHSCNNIVYEASGEPFKWKEMLDKPVNYEMEIGRLLYDIGIMIKTSYGKTSSSASTGFARLAFNELGFENAVKIERRNLDEEEWLQLFYSNLEKYQPVLVAGKGHAFVCDGYNDEGMLHFNLGGGGTGDGYYHPDCVYGTYCTNEGIFDIAPQNYFESPLRMRQEMKNDSPVITWTPPENEVPLSYKIYYTDEDSFIVEDTLVYIDDLKPGTHGIRVSAMYINGESLMIGPVWFNNPGNEISITDPAMIRAILDNPFPVPQNGSLTISEGTLSDFISLTIKDRIHSTGILNKMYRLQKLDINGTGLDQDDLGFLSGLNNLQTLNLSNINCSELPDLTLFPKLVELSLDSCNIPDFNFISGLKNLVVLRINGCNTENPVLPDGLDKLECLAVNNTIIDNLGFLNKFSNLRNLDLSSCWIRELNTTQKFDKLTCIKLDNNLLENTDFIDLFPNVKSVSATGNKIKSLKINSNHPYLHTIILSGNEINSALISFNMPSMEYLDFSNNSFSGFPVIFTTMNSLKTLNLMNNNIIQIPGMKLKALEELNLSGNNLIQINNIIQHESLKKLHLEDNQISDFSPLIENNHLKNLEFLNLKNNPISKESFLDIIPSLVDIVDTLMIPEDYDPRSPCYPSPASPSHVTNRLLGISWKCESNDPSTKYNFYFGTGDSIRLIHSNLRYKRADVILEEGQKYKWQVETVVNDSSFFSGLYKIRTTSELELPYFENFELFQNRENISTSSSNWRLTNGNSDFFQDAVITDSKKDLGQGKSINFLSTSNITIDLDHIETGTLIVEYDQLVSSGKSGHVRFENVYGLRIEILSNGDNSEVFVNGYSEAVFSVNPNLWNHFRLSVQGRNGFIVLRCNDQYIWQKKWGFHNNRVSVEGIIFSQSNPGPNWIHASFESYLDNLHIHDPDVRTSVFDSRYPENEIKIYPNPAHKELNIKGLPHGLEKVTLTIFNSLGREVLREEKVLNNQGIMLPEKQVPAGCYYYQIRSGKALIGSGKVIII